VRDEFLESLRGAEEGENVEKGDSLEISSDQAGLLWGAL